jgi:hypothetical protein
MYRALDFLQYAKGKLALSEGEIGRYSTKKGKIGRRINWAKGKLAANVHKIKNPRLGFAIKKIMPGILQTLIPILDNERKDRCQP